MNINEFLKKHGQMVNEEKVDNDSPLFDAAKSGDLSILADESVNSVTTGAGMYPIDYLIRARSGDLRALRIIAMHSSMKQAPEHVHDSLRTELGNAAAMLVLRRGSGAIKALSAVLQKEYDKVTADFPRKYHDARWGKEFVENMVTGGTGWD